MDPLDMDSGIVCFDAVSRTDDRYSRFKCRRVSRRPTYPRLLFKYELWVWFSNLCDQRYRQQWLLESDKWSHSLWIWLESFWWGRLVVANWNRSESENGIFSAVHWFFNGLAECRLLGFKCELWNVWEWVDRNAGRDIFQSMGSIVWRIASGRRGELSLYWNHTSTQL